MTIARSYGLTAQSLFAGQLNYLSDTIMMSLHTATYVPNQDTNRYFSDVSGEVSGTGYTSGGMAISGKTSIYTPSTNTLTLSATSPITIAAITVTGVKYVVFHSTSGSQPLLSYIDFETTYDLTAEDFNLSIPATGIVQIVVA